MGNVKSMNLDQSDTKSADSRESNAVECVSYNMILRAFDRGLDIMPWLEIAGMPLSRFKELMVKHNGAPANMADITNSKSLAAVQRDGWDAGYRNGMVDTIRALDVVMLYNEALAKEDIYRPAVQIACEAGMNYYVFLRTYEIYGGRPALAPAVYDLCQVVEAINSAHDA